MKKFCQKVLFSFFYSLKCFAELKKWWFKEIKLIFLNGNDWWKTSTKCPWKNFCQKIFCPIAFCLKCLSELRNEFFWWWNLLYWLVTIVENRYWNSNFTDPSSVLLSLRTPKKRAFAIGRYKSFNFCSQLAWSRLLKENYLRGGTISKNKPSLYS